jgi:hypothetical protein
MGHFHDSLFEYSFSLFQQTDGCSFIHDSLSTVGTDLRGDVIDEQAKFITLKGPSIKSACLQMMQFIR